MSTPIKGSGHCRWAHCLIIQQSNSVYICVYLVGEQLNTDRQTEGRFIFFFPCVLHPPHRPDAPAAHRLVRTREMGSADGGSGNGNGKWHLTGNVLFVIYSIIIHTGMFDECVDDQLYLCTYTKVGSWIALLRV